MSSVALKKLIEAVEEGIGWYEWVLHDGALSDDELECARNAYTGSLDAAKALHDSLLPGWWWQIGTCHLSDDARVGAPDDSRAPDGGEWSQWTDIDRRPSGNPARAWLLAVLKAKMEEDHSNA